MLRLEFLYILLRPTTTMVYGIIIFISRDAVRPGASPLAVCRLAIVDHLSLASMPNFTYLRLSVFSVLSHVSQQLPQF